ncbi:MAG: aminoacyl-tRNA hydrolase [Phycisphaerales bacterium]|nr:aminoacyl-tRNA hydrolase [Phycisphaerales bacterium]
MKLVVGLGNPGPEYDGTRHNVGFEVVDRLARRWVDPSAGVARNRFSGLLLEASIEGEKTFLLKPLTYMNLSGQAIAEAMRFYKMRPEEDLLVVVDDYALPCGSIRVKPGGGAGGHNGLEDASRRLGSDQWARLRIGIDEPGEIPLKNYVLGRFRPDQKALVEPALDQAAEAAATWVSQGLDSTMNRFNKKNSPQKAMPASGEADPTE